MCIIYYTRYTCIVVTDLSPVVISRANRHLSESECYNYIFKVGSNILVLFIGLYMAVSRGMLSLGEG